MGSIPVSIAVGRSSDQRLQVIRGDMQTSWNFYTGSGDESVWVPWEPFPADGLPGSYLQPVSSGTFLQPVASDYYPITSLAIAQLLLDSGAGASPVPVPNAGRMTAFACATNQMTNPITNLFSATKSAEGNSEPWLGWESAGYFTNWNGNPEDFPNLWAAQVAVAQLANGFLQLFASVTNYFKAEQTTNPLNFNLVTIYTCVQISPGAGAPQFSEWVEFTPAAGSGVDPSTVTPLIPIAVSLPNSDGGNDLAQPGIQAQVWLPSNPMLTSTLAYGASDPSNPAAGWTAWSPFSFPGEVPDSAIVVQTANDGSGRAYVWVNVDPSDESDLDNLGTDDSYWYYSYSMGGGEFWSPLIPFPVPEPSALTLDSNFPVGVAGPVCLNVIGAAPLPSGALQVFYLGVSGQVYTCIQNQPADASTPGTFPAMEPFNPPYFEALILEAIRNGAIFRDIAGLRLPWIP